MVDLLVHTNHRMGDMYYNTEPLEHLDEIFFVKRVKKTDAKQH